ncbi:MAG TPA: GNAT family N-acetyltransferase [Acidothermaceae bacterium]
MATFTGPVALRPMTRDDFPALAAWLRMPHVEAWFPWEQGPADPAEAVEVEYGPCIDGLDPTELFVIEVDAGRVGFIQRYRISDNPAWAAALAPALDASAAVGIDNAIGFDYAIGVVEATGRGIGSEAIRQLAVDTFDRYADVDGIVVAMQQANRASWRALERVGFERRWAGLLDSPDPSDAGPSYVYALARDVAASVAGGGGLA